VWHEQATLDGQSTHPALKRATFSQREKEDAPARHLYT